MREVPMRYVKANQVGIVLFVLLSFVFNPLVVLGALWSIQVVGLASSGKLNLFVQIGKAVLTGKGTETQAVEPAAIQQYSGCALPVSGTHLVLAWLGSRRLCIFRHASRSCKRGSAGVLCGLHGVFLVQTAACRQKNRILRLAEEVIQVSGILR